jgi:hypothetical protein
MTRRTFVPRLLAPVFGAGLLLGTAGLVPAVVSAAPPFDQGFWVDCYHDGNYVTGFQVNFGPTKNAGTAFHLENDTSILTSNGYAVNGQHYPPRGMAAVDTRGDSVVCTGTFGADVYEITGWITPRG